jgi:hypothetical protein
MAHFHRGKSRPIVQNLSSIEDAAAVHAAIAERLELA